MKHSPWFKACGDEHCGTCKRPIVKNEDAHYNAEADLLRCMNCVDAEEDRIIGAVDALDSRYNEEE